jgi:DNA recombination protein RmuC
VGFVPTYKHFSGFGLFLLPSRIHARPPAANANRWALRVKQKDKAMQIDTTTIIIGGVAILVVILLIVIIIALFLQFRNIRGNTNTFTLVQSEIRSLGERIEKVESNQGTVNQGVNFLGTEVRGLSERITSVEKNQSMINQGVGYLATNTLSSITELKTLTSGVTDATNAIRTELARAKNDLTELHTHVKTGQQAERQIADSVRRLETIIAGTQTKGSAGENVLEVVFSKLPIEWQVRDFKIGGKSVEFALRLPNNLIMPIDSKWAATNLLEQFINTEDLQEQQRLKKSIEDVVLSKAKEVRKYLDPSITVNFGVAVVPDAVYDLCAGIQSETFQLNVVLVSYSMFVPYLLLVFQTTLKNSQSIDLQKVDAYLQTAHESIKNLQDELDGRFSRAITMMNNSRDDMRAVLGKLGGSLTGLQIGAGSALSLPEIKDKISEG